MPEPHQAYSALRRIAQRPEIIGSLYPAFIYLTSINTQDYMVRVALDNAYEWSIVEIKLDQNMVLRVAFRRTYCPGTRSQCIVVAYSVEREPRLVIAPAQPTPFCVRGDKVDTYVLRRVLEGLGERGYLASFCRIVRHLLRETLEETLKHLSSLGIITY